MTLGKTLVKIKSRAVRAAGPLGLYRLSWMLSHARPRVFMYHRFAAHDSAHRLGQRTLREQVKLLKRRFRIVTMGELAECLRNEPETAAGLAVITVDDGYRDFYEYAWPVLQEARVSATFFPVTGFVDRELWLWPDLVQYGLDHSPRRMISGEEVRLAGGRFELDDPASQRLAWQGLIDLAIDLPDAEKWSFLGSLLESLGLQWPEAIPDEYAPVSWDELRQMSGDGIEIGAHTYSHCRLPCVSEQQLEIELAGARARLESEIQRPVVSLCYPNGSPHDYDARVMEAAKQAGYKSAVTSFFDGRIGGIFELRRHGAGPDMFQFDKCLWGVEDLAQRGRDGRAAGTET